LAAGLQTKGSCCDRFKSGEVQATNSDIKRFATDLDPKPFYLDEAAAAAWQWQARPAVREMADTLKKEGVEVFIKRSPALGFAGIDKFPVLSRQHHDVTQRR